MDIDQPSAPAVGEIQTTDTTGVASTHKTWEPFFNAGNEALFVPWPNEEVIRRGALASIQVLLDKGVDPWTFDPEKSAELEAERVRIADAEEAERQKRDEERRMDMVRRMSMSGSGGAGEVRREEAPKVFQLETFDDDEDDD